MVAQASNAKLARYYLRTMEDVNNGVRDSGFDATNDPERFDLEHVMPRKPEPGWHVDEDTISRYANRIGNLAMLKKGDNSTVRSKPFAEKREAYTRSGFALTKMILSEAEWTPRAIEARQVTLADLALRAWPVAPPAKPPRAPRAKRPRDEDEDEFQISHRTMREATGT